MIKILFSILILVFCCASASAHSCATFQNLSDEEYRKKLREVDYIFEGEAVSYTHLSNQSSLITYKVSRIWKGNLTEEITIKFDNPCSMGYGATNEPIGVPIKAQKSRKTIVYGYLHEYDQQIHINCCNFNLFDDARMKLEYGEGIMIEQPAPQPSPQPEKTTAGFWSWLRQKISSIF